MMKKIATPPTAYASRSPGPARDRLGGAEEQPDADGAAEGDELDVAVAEVAREIPGVATWCGSFGDGEGAGTLMSRRPE